METYGYTAVDAKGKTIKGSIEAETRERAAERIKAEGNLPIKIQKQTIMTKDIDFAFLRKKPSARDLSVFCRQFVSIMEAGVPVISALEMLSEQTENTLLAQALADTQKDVEKGQTLTEAMQKHRKIFGTMLLTLVEAGEASGTLSTSFTRMAEQYEKDAHIQALIRKAMVYPIVVCIIAVCVVAFMLTFVIPTFEDMFADLGTELPALTKAVIAASAFLQSYWYLVLLGIMVVAVGVGYYRRTTSGQILFGRIEMKIPILKDLVVKTASARFSRTLSTLISSGLPLLESLDITANTMTNYHFQKAVYDIRDTVSMGTGLADPLLQANLFPPMVCHMVKIGEETGNLDGMLRKLADYYDDEVEIATQTLMAALEPLIIVLLAAIVGTIIMAIMLPMASMYDSLDNL